MNVVNQGDGHELSATVTAVAVDGEKNSQQAVKWTVDHLLIGHYSFILLHVKPKTIINHGFSIADTTNEGGQEQQEQDMTDLFLPFRGFCARRGVKIIEVVLEDDDVSKAIADYINNNQVHNIVVGASNRNMFTKKFRNPDVPSNLIKMAPEFCAVYVISKGKPLTVRSAKGPLPATTARPPLLASTTSNFREMDDAVKTPFGRANSQSMAAPSGPSSVPDRTSGDRNMYYAKTPSRDRPFPGNMPTNMIAEHSDAPYHYTNPSASHDGFSAYMDFQRGVGFNSMDMDSFKLSTGLPDSPRDSHLPTNELEAEMRRLKLELKQTMDMYNNACKEAISAKQKTRELEQWQAQEARRLEQARQAEEAALAIAEMEKARAKAAIETAEAAKRIAQLEAQKRQSAEMKAKREAEEKTRALDALAQNDVRYRKYSIEEIEIATDYFAEKLKIGEGGYGPVYRACLDHTPVAIKVLRPDAAQGRKQFQQEVEVLSCIRHPNMVLLLGACPEYGCLVYEYMDNGSLEDRLYRRGNTPSIPWSTRFKIAAEIATGLLFLHQTKPEPLVHRDLKPANILLDRNYVSKISDVGLARLVPPSVANSVTQYRLTSTAGTFCYIDPEYQQTGMLGIKSDIYSLGILLLQIITGRPPMGLAHHVERAIEKGVFAEILDPSVKDWPVEEALSFAKIAIKCSELKRKDRPDLGTVILPELNRLRNLGHAFEASLMGGSGSAIISFSGLPQSFPLSSSSGSHQIQQHSLQNQEKMMASSNDAISWKSTSDASGR